MLNTKNKDGISSAKILLSTFLIENNPKITAGKIIGNKKYSSILFIVMSQIDKIIGIPKTHEK